MGLSGGLDDSSYALYVAKKEIMGLRPFKLSMLMQVEYR
jgi:hypothetical protein